MTCHFSRPLGAVFFWPHVIMHSMKNSPSIDPKEVAHFDALASTWWQPQGPFWPLHLLNKVRIEYLMSALAPNPADPARPFTGLRVLDVGCGGGLLAEAMAQRGAEVTGVDVVPRNIEIARRHAASSGLAVRYEVISVEELALQQPQCFDLVLNMEVVEHVADLPVFMAACCALVRPGGRQVVATINRNAWAWFAAVFMAERVLRLLPKGTHHWAKLRKPAEINALLAAHGFKPEAQVGISLNPFTRHMKLTASLAINYLLLAQKTQ